MPVAGGTTRKLSNAFCPQPQELVALAVALELDLALRSSATDIAEHIHLHRVIDDEIDRHQRVDLLRIAAEAAHRVSAWRRGPRRTARR
jgi:hypothetical protein